MTGPEHYAVLLQESVAAILDSDLPGRKGNSTSGVYIDGTYGRGGHSRAILAHLSAAGRLLAFDKDPEAIANGNELAAADNRFRIHHGSFTRMSDALTQLSWGEQVDGILLDLGVSSPQLDNAERGFSFLKDGPLDMRMNTGQALNAADWVNSADEQQIARVLWEFGEERFSRRIARAIVEERKEQPITGTGRLAEIVKRANPRWEKDKHPATRAFQAIRIFINQELDDLQVTLERAIDILKPGGRLVVISFHSLEDRIVKRFFKTATKGPVLPKEVMITSEMWQPKLKVVGKAVKAGGVELSHNIRSRSAVMRVAEKIDSDF